MLPRYTAGKQENFVFTDEIWTKQIISDFYESFSINFRNYRLRKFADKSYKAYRLGCIADGFSLFAEIYLLVKTFKKRIINKSSPENYERFLNLYDKLKTKPDDISLEDLYFVLEFTNLFMNVTGMKNISRMGDGDRPGFVNKT